MGSIRPEFATRVAGAWTTASTDPLVCRVTTACWAATFSNASTCTTATTPANGERSTLSSKRLRAAARAAAVTSRRVRFCSWLIREITPSATRRSARSNSAWAASWLARTVARSVLSSRRSRRAISAPSATLSPWRTERSVTFPACGKPRSAEAVASTIAGRLTVRTFSSAWSTRSLAGRTGASAGASGSSEHPAAARARRAAAARAGQLRHHPPKEPKSAGGPIVLAMSLRRSRWSAAPSPSGKVPLPVEPGCGEHRMGGF